MEIFLPDCYDKRDIFIAINTPFSRMEVLSYTSNATLQLAVCIPTSYNVTIF